MKKILIGVLLLNSTLLAEMIKPANGSSINYTHVLFEWEQIGDAVEYEIQVSTSSTFSSVLVSSSTTSLIYINTEDLNWSGTYYWRIRPVFSDDILGSWFEPFSFSTTNSMSSVDITMYNSSEFESGITFLGSLDGAFSAAFDQGGEIWNTSSSESIIMYNTNLKGELYGCRDLGVNYEFPLPALEFNLDGEYVWEEPNDQYVHHDIIRLPDGNYLSIAEEIEYHPIPSDGSWYDECLFTWGSFICGEDIPWVGDKLVIWDKDSKDVVWEWSVFDHYSINDYDGVNEDQGYNGDLWIDAILDWRFDWTHVNSVTYKEEENAIYISCRHLSRITKIYFDDSNYSDPQNGSIIWNLGEDMPSGDIHCGHDINFSWQHSVSVLDNGNITILDNGNLNNPAITRALEIDPNETSNGCDAEVVWEHSLPQSLFGLASGNNQKLDNGNYLITTVAQGGTTLEISSDHDIIWEAKYNLPLGLIHRAYRVSSLYPVEVSAIASNYTDFDGLSVIEVSSLDSARVWFNLYNNGSEDEEFKYSLTEISENGEVWYQSQEGIIEIESGGYQTISFAAINMGSSSFNEIELMVSSVNNHNIAKSYNYTVRKVEDLTNQDAIVEGFHIINLYPNPFNPSTTISLEVRDILSGVSIRVYDVNGHFIEKLFSGNLNPGTHTITWKPRNLSTGKYFLHFTSDHFSAVKEVVYIK